MEFTPTVFVERLAGIKARIKAAAIRTGRDPSRVLLLAVSKAQPIEKVRAALESGHLDFGENYAQELAEKLDSLQEARFHFIGGLQRNKVRQILGRVAMIHSVDRMSLLDEMLRRWRPEMGPCRFLIEVNLAGEASKSGCEAAEVMGLVQRALDHDANLVPAGLMTVPPFSLSPEETRPFFKRLVSLKDEITASLAPGNAELFCHLSMGMSGDFEVAVEEGATIVRVGTALFGSRR